MPIWRVLYVDHVGNEYDAYVPAVNRIAAFETVAQWFIDECMEFKVVDAFRTEV